MQNPIEPIEPAQTERTIDNILNIKRNRETRFMKNFMEKMACVFPQLDLTYNEDFQFVDESTRQHFATYQLGWSARESMQPGVYVMARMTEQGLEFAQTPYLMDNYKNARWAEKRMRKRTGGEFFIFSATKGAFEVIKKIAGKSFGRLKSEDELQIPVVIADRTTRPKDEQA